MDKSGEEWQGGKKPSLVGFIGFLFVFSFYINSRAYTVLNNALLFVSVISEEKYS